MCSRVYIVNKYRIIYFSILLALYKTINHYFLNSMNNKKQRTKTPSKRTPKQPTIALVTACTLRSHPGGGGGRRMIN